MAAEGADEVSDHDLLAAHVAGDADAFGTLFARHRDRLWAVALRTTGDPEVAADGLQEGMIAAFRRADSFRGDARVTTWLHRIVVNACLDRLRAEKVRAAEPLADDPERSPREAIPTTSSREADDPAVHADRRDQQRQVVAALAQLPDEQRAAVVLVDMEGYPVAEVAEILDCAVGTVKSRCARARAKLVDLLQGLLAEDSEPPATPERNHPAVPDVGSVSRRGPPEGEPAP